MIVFRLLQMSYELLGIGGTAIVSAANDGTTALKGYEVWDGDQCCAFREEDGCEKLLAKEDSVYRLLGEICSHSEVLWARRGAFKCAFTAVRARPRMGMSASLSRKTTLRLHLKMTG